MLTDQGMTSRGQGLPSWGQASARGYSGVGPGYQGVMKPVPVGARYFCGDDYPQSVAQNEPCAVGNKWDQGLASYQDHVTAHYTEEHPDLHYPIDQTAEDDFVRAKSKAASAKAHAQLLLEMAKATALLAKVVGGLDVSLTHLPVERPRELPDITEFDFPDANVADAATEEIELDQLISLSARMGRRFLGVELEGLGNEIATELITLSADAVLASGLQLNTRTGGRNIDEPEQLWRFDINLAMNVTEGSQEHFTEDMLQLGGKVYVAPRLFWRFTNNLDRQVDVGDLFTRVYTIDQRLSTFLLFELLEEFSGLFALA